VRKKIKSILFPFFVVLLLAVAYFSFKIWQKNYKSPIGENFQFNYITDKIWPRKNKHEAIVYGFLPYWNINKVKIQAELTHLSYFALEVGVDGQIVVESKPGESEPGYRQLNSDQFFALIDERNLNLELVLSQFDSKKIEQLLSDQKAWLTLLEQIDSLLLAYPFTGINLDFEYQGEVNEILRQQFTNFVISIHNHLAQHQEKINLSVDVYASAGDPEKQLLWNVPALEPYLDYLVVMAYDFHRQSSTQAGPGAPLFGAGDLWNSDINSLMKGFFEQVPKEKILLGIPFYGYAWQTDSLEPSANTYPGTGFTVSYKEVLNLKKLSGIWENCENLEIFWQEDALSPYATLTCPKTNQKENEESESTNYLIYFEDEKSLQYKIDFAKQLEIAGIAIWALGYDGDIRNLWEKVRELRF
jgi:spore germination protein YaaH